MPIHIDNPVKKKSRLVMGLRKGVGKQPRKKMSQLGEISKYALSRKKKNNG